MMTEVQHKILKASPLYTPMHGMVPFRVVLRAWDYDDAGNCVEWAVHTEYIDVDRGEPYYEHGHYSVNYDQALRRFEYAISRKSIRHDTVRRADEIRDFRSKVRVKRENWDDIGQKLDSVIDEIEYNEETSVTPEMYAKLQTIKEHYDNWTRTVTRFMNQ